MKLLQTFIIILFLNVSYLSAEDGKTPNIIFILTDDQRYDEIGAVGNFPWLVTPNLDKLLKEGIYFKNAFCYDIALWSLKSIFPYRNIRKPSWGCR